MKGRPATRWRSRASSRPGRGRRQKGLSGAVEVRCRATRGCRTRHSSGNARRCGDHRHEQRCRKCPAWLEHRSLPCSECLVERGRELTKTRCAESGISARQGPWRKKGGVNMTSYGGHMPSLGRSPPIGCQEMTSPRAVLGVRHRPPRVEGASSRLMSRFSPLPGSHAPV